MIKQKFRLTLASGSQRDVFAILSSSSCSFEGCKIGIDAGRELKFDPPRGSIGSKRIVGFLWKGSTFVSARGVKLQNTKENIKCAEVRCRGSTGQMRLSY